MNKQIEMLYTIHFYNIYYNACKCQNKLKNDFLTGILTVFLGYYKKG